MKWKKRNRQKINKKMKEKKETYLKSGTHKNL